MKKKLGQIDQAGAEALIVAYLCRAGRYRQLFLFGIKPHTYVAMRIFKEHWAKLLGLRDIEEYLNAPIPKLSSLPYWKDLAKLIKNDDDKYYVGKKTAHSSSYGVKGPTFQLSVLLDTEGKLIIPIQDCKIFLNIFLHELFPEISEWQFDIQQELNNGRVLKNLFGDSRRFTGPWGEDLFRKAYAFKPQSTVGVLDSRAILAVQDELDEGMHREYGLDILNNNHDSMLVQFYDNGCDVEVGKLLQSKMNMELTSPRGEKFFMRSEFQTGYNWRPYDKEKNPDGMREVLLS